ncbi:MAG TPA: carboxypeptidase regulatory-like domain-containing protein, partial [Pirellulales bacterium]|nr:carboxypeptidase regulatory-like domain-containing protein [Pirellulales bacterium]
MRRTTFTVWPWLVVSFVLFSASSLAAATIEGRVVDSAGQPVAGAEVRIWQRFTGADRRSSIRPVEFDGSEVLHADAEGRFVSPDMLDSNASATMIVAEAEGLLAGRSGWLRIAKDVAAVQASDLVLKRLRVVVGQVLDRRGQPVDGATVFNSGDGHERVETTSKGGGKFRLAAVPDGGVFLFAEKPGYRLTGILLAAEKAEAALTLTSINEPAEPMATLPPLLTPDEEYALARQLLDPWLERLAKSGTEQQWRYGYQSLARIDGLEAFNRVDTPFDLDPQSRETFRFNAIDSVIKHHVRIPREKLRAMIESGDNEYYKAVQFIQAADAMGNGERAVRLEWLEAAMPHARKIDEPARRAWVLASVAERLFGLGEVEPARQILVEAEDLVKPLIADTAVQYAALRLALAAAQDDPNRALGWLDQAGMYVGRSDSLAVKFLPNRPQQAVEIWKRVVAANRKERLSWVDRVGHPLPIQVREYRAAAEFCYHLALANRALAEPIAAEAEDEAMRFWQKGAVILALAETEPAEAREQLTSLVREELPQFRDEDSQVLPPMSAPAVAVWLLPIAEKVAPELCRELFWRSLALRLPRRRDHLQGEIEVSDIELAKLLGRYDREIARALLEPLIGDASTGGGEREPTAERMTVSGFLFPAAVHIDPRWAKSLLDAVGDSSSMFGPYESTRLQFVSTLALPPPKRWDGAGAWPVDFSAGYWAPAARDQTLPP